MIFCNFRRIIIDVRKPFVRYKNPSHHWSVLRKKSHPVDKALLHFDDFYDQVYQKQWPDIREGLLSQQKYVAVVNNYGDCEATKEDLELKGAFNIRTLVNLEKTYIKEELAKKARENTLKEVERLDKLDEKRKLEQFNTESNVTEYEAAEDKLTTDSGLMSAKRFSLQSSLENAEIDIQRLVDPKNALSTELLNEFVPATKIKGKDDFISESEHYSMFDSSSNSQIRVKKEYDLHFPENLNVYCYEKSNYSKFDQCRICDTGVFNYYLMDGGSLLPVLALDLRPGCRVLDMCASPGGKSLLALQTLYPEAIVSNDVSYSRVQRIENVFNQFLFDFKEKWINTGKISLINSDARYMEYHNFNRILVDVPCTTDRHSLKENDNNIFKPSRIKERLTLPELQSELLVNALKLISENGIVVYSTCTLSPIQNDGVVQNALRRIFEETDRVFIVKDQSPALLATRKIYRLASRKYLKYGHLVLPMKDQNYGPTYFCKLQRVK